MNPYLIIAALVAVMAAGAGGFRLGVDHEKASEADKQETVQAAVDAANQSSAKAIAGLRPIYTTIQSEVQREIQTNTVYADCRHSPDGLRLLNQALNGGAKSPSGGELPKVDASGR